MLRVSPCLGTITQGALPSSLPPSFPQSISSLPSLVTWAPLPCVVTTSATSRRRAGEGWRPDVGLRKGSVCHGDTGSPWECGSTSWSAGTGRVLPRPEPGHQETAILPCLCVDWAFSCLQLLRPWPSTESSLAPSLLEWMGGWWQRPRDLRTPVRGSDPSEMAHSLRQGGLPADWGPGAHNAGTELERCG